MHPGKGWVCVPCCGQSLEGLSAEWDHTGWFTGGLLQNLGWDGMGWSGPGAEPPSLSVSHLKQSYIQSFRERQTGPSLNSLITSSHAVVDLDYDCSSTVPLTTGSGPAVRV